MSIAPSTVGTPFAARRQHVIGRDREITEVLDAVDHAVQSVITLTGVGGSGKTTAAVEAAHRLDEQFARRWFVDLTRVTRGVDVPVHVGHTLGLRIGNGSPHEVLVAELGTGPTLVLLDNCEHVLDEVADLVSALAADCPELTVLATSRRPLGLAVERVIPLGPLAVRTDDSTPAPAVRLLAERARAAGGDVADDGPDAVHLEAACRRLDGLPLALVLAATRLRTMTPAELAARLDRDLELPAVRGGSAHQRTMRASLDWSLALLSPQAADLYHRSSVFAATFDAERCRTVCRPDADEATVVSLLTELVEHSLLVADTSAERTRYRMLAVVREHARSALTPSEAEDLLAAHRRHVVELATDGTTYPRNITPAGVRRLEDVHDEIVEAFDAAVEAGDVGTGLELLMVLQPFWRVTGRLRFALDRALPLAERCDGTARAIIQLTCADLEQVLGRLDDAARHVHEALTHFRTAGPDLAPRYAVALGVTGNIACDQGRYDEARAAYHELSTDILDANAQMRAMWCANLGRIELAAGRDDAARPLLEEALRLYGNEPAMWLSGRALGHLGTLARRRGEPEQARDLLLEALDHLAEYGALAEAAPLVDELAVVLDALGRRDVAATCRSAAAGMRRRIGSPAPHDPHDDERSTPDISTVVDLVRAVDAEPAAPAVLTPRELEVAELVADGLTNPQIAERLVISPGTARTHVERIRTKLGVSSRVQVARWVLDRYVDRQTR